MAPTPYQLRAAARAAKIAGQAGDPSTTATTTVIPPSSVKTPKKEGKKDEAEALIEKIKGVGGEMRMV